MTRAVVLIVEDQALLRMMAADFVEEAGFEAVEAADAAGAIRCMEARADIKLLFSDVVMPPGMSGVDLAGFISRRWPKISIILTSGHACPDQGSMPSGSTFFPKPYLRDSVVAEMRRMSA